MTGSFRGGEKLEARLKEIARRIGTGKAVKAGFLENATYPDGTSVPMVAYINEFGATIQVPEHQVEVYRKIAKDGDFLNGGRFVKAAKSNFATTHTVPAHQVTVPARPYFRPMVTENKGHWGEDLAKLIKAADHDTKQALGQMGARIAGELRASIVAVTEPPNAPSTVAQKGSDKPLVDSGNMLNSIDYEVEE